jgi:hypothetical protein
LISRLISFAFDFKSSHCCSDFLDTQLVLDTTSGPTTVFFNTNDGFFGFTSSESFTSITFQPDPNWFHDVAYVLGIDNVAATFAKSTVGIDIKPGGLPNPINPRSAGNIR